MNCLMPFLMSLFLILLLIFAGTSLCKISEILSQCYMSSVCIIPQSFEVYMVLV